jgi:hypothetical protein
VHLHKSFKKLSNYNIQDIFNIHIYAFNITPNLEEKKCTCENHSKN